MHSFKDPTGREWTVRIDVQTMRDVRAALGVNLFALVEDKFRPFGELLSDPLRLVDVLYVVCREQCKAAGMTDEDFGRMFLGDSILAARDAFADAYTDFFPGAEIRANLRAIMAKIRQATGIAAGKLSKKAQAALDALTPESMAEMLIAHLETKSNDGVSSSPGSSASIPDPGPSVT